MKMYMYIYIYQSLLLYKTSFHFFHHASLFPRSTFPPFSLSIQQTSNRQQSSTAKTRYNKTTQQLSYQRSKCKSIAGKEFLTGITLIIQEVFTVLDLHTIPSNAIQLQPSLPELLTYLKSRKHTPDPSHSHLNAPQV